MTVTVYGIYIYTWGIWVVFPLPVSPTIIEQVWDLNSFNKASLAGNIGRDLLSSASESAIIDNGTW